MQEHRDMSMDEAKKMGAAAQFGEKYGEKVRVVAFDEDYSAELCGGTHVDATGQIGLFAIVSEGAIAAGIRRVEAVTGRVAEDHVRSGLDELDAVSSLLKHPKDPVQALEQVLRQNEVMRKELESLQQQQLNHKAAELAGQAEDLEGMKFIATRVEMDAKSAKDLAFKLKGMVSDLVLVLGHLAGGKPGITVIISENIVKEKGLHAGNMVRELAAHIKGGGGGQPFFATAGGKDPDGLEKAVTESRNMLK